MFSILRGNCMALKLSLLCFCNVSNRRKGKNLEFFQRTLFLKYQLSDPKNSFCCNTLHDGNICRIIRSFSSPLIGIPAIYSVLTITLSHRLYKSGLDFLKLISLNQSLFLSAHERPVLIVHGF